MTNTVELSDRRPTYLMDTPCLTRNYIVRFGERFDITSAANRKAYEEQLKRGASDDAPSRVSSQLLDRINAYIAEFDEASEPFVGSRPIERFVEDDADPADKTSGNRNKKRHETVFGVRRLRGVPVEIFIDLHREYMTVQFRAYPLAADNHTESSDPYVASVARILEALTEAPDFEKEDWAGLTGSPRSGWDSSRLIEDHALFADVCALRHTSPFDFLHPENGDAHIDEAGKDKEQEAVARLLYDEFWYRLLDCPKKQPDQKGLSPKRLFADKLLLPKTQETATDQAPSTDHADEAGTDHQEDGWFELLAIFKGVVVRPVIASEHTGFSKPSEQQTADLLASQDRPDLETNRFRKPIVATIPDPRNKEAPFSEEDCQHVYEAGIAYMNRFSQLYSRILGYRKGTNKFDDHIAGNTVLCGVLKGLAIYGSSFGRNTTSNNDKPEVRYFVAYQGPSRNQLSRLVRRINLSGEARVLALLDLKKVRVAGDELRRVDADLNDAILHKDATGPNLSKLRKRIIEAISDEKVRGGLVHRVGRTDYYSELLKHRIKDLRIRRLAGWQTYDEYIRRIFEPQFDTYRRIGRRLQDVQQRLADADEILETGFANRLALAGVIFASLIVVTILSEALQTPLAVSVLTDNGANIARAGLLITASCLAIPILIMLGLSFIHRRRS